MKQQPLQYSKEVKFLRIIKKWLKTFLKMVEVLNNSTKTQLFFFILFHFQLNIILWEIMKENFNQKIKNIVK